MHPRLRLAILAAAVAVLAVIVGLQVADESYFLGEIVVCGLLWLVAERLQGPLPDAWGLAALLVGYIVGNRGFAQFFLRPNLPLLPAEAGLLVCAPLLIFRMAFKQAAALQRDGLNFAILAWMLLGAVRLPFDLRQYGFIALRDSATVYYASFFFIAQAFCRHEASRSLLRRALRLAFLLLPVVSVALSLAPEFFLTMFTWRGVPLVYHKGDLVATYLSSGFFFFWAMREAGAHRAWLIPAAVCLLMSPTMGSPRAAMFGTVMVTLIWLIARRPRLLLFQVGAVTAGFAAVLLVLVSYGNKDLRETTAYSVYEHAISIVDFEGTGTYLHAETGDPGNNNRFRLVWWNSVAQETLQKSPAFGLGFGADLAARFLVDYNLVEAEDFVTRSPHSVIMTVFGRMGTLGLLLFLTIAAMMARSAWPAFRRRDFDAMGLWSVTWVLWFSACFGVVLEGPMGAVVFWTVLGMANATTAAEQAQRETADGASHEPTTADSPAAPLPNAGTAVLLQPAP
jgi:hypothetical protein